MEFFIVFGSFFLIIFIYIFMEFIIEKCAKWSYILVNISIALTKVVMKEGFKTIVKLVSKRLRFVSLHAIDKKNINLSHSNTFHSPIVYENPPQDVLRKDL